MVQVLSGFPGVGKTYFRTHARGVVDSDSSLFSWLPPTPGEPKKRDRAWPGNYIKHIQRMMLEPGIKFILVSSHQEVRDALVAAGIPFILVYPDLSIKDEYIQRYIQRGNAPDFVMLLEANYDAWITALANQKGCEHCVLQSGEYLVDVVARSLASKKIQFTPAEKAAIVSAHNILVSRLENRAGGFLAHNLSRALAAAKTRAHNITEAKAWVVKAFLKGFDDADGLPASHLDGLAEWRLRGILAGLGYDTRDLHLDNPDEHVRLFQAARASNVALASAEHRYFKETTWPCNGD